MENTHAAVIITSDKSFFERFSHILEAHGFRATHIKKLNDLKKKQIAAIDICLVDNYTHTFLYNELFEYINQYSPQTVIINVGTTPPPQPKGNNFLYHCRENHIDLNSFLFNLGEFIRRAKSRTELAAMLIHDIRSPLHSMLAYIELLLNQTFGQLNDGQKNFLEKAMILGDQTLDMVEDINEIYKSEQYIFSLEKEPFDIFETIEQAMLNLWIQADQKNIQIRKENTPNLPKVYGDSFQIQRVFVNLINNSIKYCPENSEIIVRVTQASQRKLEIAIIDNGGGIPEDDLKHIFRKAFRGKNHAKRQAGYGLGLYICKIIIKAHSGTIRAVNNHLGGVTFKFTLPIAKTD